MSRESARGRVHLVAAACLAVLVSHAAAGIAWAQDESSAQPPQQQTDLRDLWRRFRHQQEPGDAQPEATTATKSFLVMAPSLSSKPSTGLMLGLGATLAFVHGDPATTHLSSASASIKVSLKDQVLSGVRFGTFTDDDRWFVQGDNRFQWTSLDTYDVGGDSAATSAANLEYDWFRVYETAYRQVAPRLFVGGGVNLSDHANVHSDSAVLDRTAYATYSEQHGFAPDRQVSAGTNVGVLFDTRDNPINAARGWLANTVYRTFFDRFLGGESTWQELNVDLRTYRPLTRSGRQKLAFWFLGDLVTGGTAPYFDLPGSGGDMYGRSARGYTEGRYRGPHMLYGEMEYRATLVPSGLFGVVAFMNTATFSGDSADRRLFQSFEPAGGAGARILLDKRSRTNLCVDYGWGRQGSRGLYLAMQEAF